MSKILITEQMIMDFNLEMIIHGSIVRLYPSDVYGSVRIGHVADIYINQDGHIMRVTENFYETLESFFSRRYKIEKLHYNNTGSTFWAFEE
jgi:hypothetical protein